MRLKRHGQGGQWKLVHPPCAIERAEDLEEVEAMLEGGETELAVDELRWLLEDCRDLVRAHQLLGEIALESGDHKLARAHFGYVHDVGRAALGADAPPGPVPYQLAENQVWHESSKGLAWCLHQLGRDDLALEVVREMLRWDPGDPLGVRPWLSAWAAPQ